MGQSSHPPPTGGPLFFTGCLSPTGHIGTGGPQPKAPPPTQVEKRVNLQLHSSQLMCRRWLRKLHDQKHQFFESSTFSFCINGQQRLPGPPRSGHVSFASFKIKNDSTSGRNLNQAQSTGPSSRTQANQSKADHCQGPTKIAQSDLAH